MLYTTVSSRCSCCTCCTTAGLLRSICRPDRQKMAQAITANANARANPPTKPKRPVASERGRGGVGAAVAGCIEVMVDPELYPLEPQLRWLTRIPWNHCPLEELLSELRRRDGAE